MFLPIGDENPRERTPYVNYALLGANILAFLLFCFPHVGYHENTLLRYAMIPADLKPHTLFTSMFLHAGFMHLAGNMLFLWIFGDNVEDRLGHLGYLAFYLGCGLAADGLHIASNPDSPIPTIGASGAISGVVGAYAVFFPRHKVKLLVLFFLFIQIFRISAVWWVGLWFFWQVFLGILQSSDGGVAHWAHVGGFLAGAGIAALVRFGLSTLKPAVKVPSEIRNPSRTRAVRRPFITLEEPQDVVFLPGTDDRYVLLRLTDELHHVSRIASIAAGATGETPREVARRLEATRGLIARGLTRTDAERVQRDLHVRGLPAALILDVPANRPPEPALVQSGGWDDRFIRFTSEGEPFTLAWTSPFLYIGARLKGREFIDIFVNRGSAFRITEETSLTAVDPRRRTESDAGLADLARAIIDRRSGAALNDGIRVLAKHGAWGWLSFRSPRDYEDYLFWVYNLILSQVPLHRA
jgi:membrane associated rhomboid family serine protease